MSAYSSSYFPIKKKILHKKKAKLLSMMFSPRDVVKHSLQSDKFPASQDFNLLVQSKKFPVGTRNSPHWSSRPSPTSISALEGPLAGSPADSASRAVLAGPSLNGNGLSFTSGVKNGPKSSTDIQQESKIFMVSPDASLRGRPNTHLQDNNLGSHYHGGTLHLGSSDIPYSAETLGLSGPANSVSRSPSIDKRTFEVVPISFEGNDIVFGNSKDLGLPNSRNPIEMNSLSETIAGKTPPFIEGVDFASELKGSAVNNEGIPIVGLPTSVAQKVIDVVGTVAASGGDIANDIIGVNAIAAKDAVGMLMNDIGTVGKSSTLGGIAPQDGFLGSDLSLPGENNIMGNMNSPAGVLNDISLGSSVTDNLMVPKGLVPQKLISVENLARESGLNNFEDKHRAGRLSRYSGYMLNIEPFGPGPYGECRVPSQVVCGARPGWEHVIGMGDWCKSNCVVFMYSSYCDDNRCECQCTKAL